MRLADQEEKPRRALVRADRRGDRTRARSQGSRARPVVVPAHLRSERRAAPARAGREPGRSRVRPADVAAERSRRSQDRRGRDARGARSRRHPADAGRRRDADAALDARHDSRPRALARARHRLDRRRDLRRQRRPRRGVRHRLRAWPATPAAARSCSPPGSPARWPARCRWAPARTSRRSREREVYESEVAREQAEIEEDPHEELLELELFYQLKGFSAEEARVDGRAAAEGTEAVPAHARPRRARPVGGNLSEPAGARRCRRRVSTAIGGFIPIIPFFFTVGMPAVIASFVISTIAHFVVGASKALVTTRSWWASGAEMTHRRHHRSGDHLRPRRGVRRPLTSCRPRLSTFEDSRSELASAKTAPLQSLSTDQVLWHLHLRLPLPAKRFAGGAT